MRTRQLFLLLSLVTLPACSVGMAASGHKEQDTSIVFPGSNRAVIVAKLGAPETSRKLEDGRTVDSYLVKKGNEASSGRAWAHAGLDILSLGLWEVIATPYELAQGEESSRIEIVYDAAGTVQHVQQAGGQIPPAPQPVAPPVAVAPVPAAPAATVIPVGGSLPAASPQPPAVIPAVAPAPLQPPDNPSTIDMQMRNLQREYNAGRIGLDEYLRTKKIITGE